MRQAARFFINRHLARGWSVLHAIWMEKVQLRESARKRRLLHKELIAAERRAALLFTMGPSSEFLAKDIYEAKRVRLLKDIAEDRKTRGVRAFARPFTPELSATLGSLPPTPNLTSMPSTPVMPSGATQFCVRRKGTSSALAR